MCRRPFLMVKQRSSATPACQTSRHCVASLQIPTPVHQLRIEKREGGEGTRLWVDNLDGLLGLVALGAVELHPWNSTVESFERADRLVIDLDPGEGGPWEAVGEAALRTRWIVQKEGLSTWPKLTGCK